MVHWSPLLCHFYIVLYSLSLGANGDSDCTSPLCCAKIEVCDFLSKGNGSLAECFKEMWKMMSACFPPRETQVSLQVSISIPEGQNSLLKKSKALQSIQTPPVIPPSFSHKNENLLPKRCGLSVFEKIISGEIANRGEFPWMVLLVFKGESGFEQLKCGGTIISERYVLTAAHCFDDKNYTLSHTRLGEYSLLEEECEETLDCNGHVNAYPEKVIIHPNWDPAKLKNDIALIRLNASSRIKGRGDIGPICLPLNVTALDIKPYTNFETAGWGLIEHDEEANSNVLRKVNLTNSEDDCRICIDANFAYCPLAKSQMCVQGAIRQDVCKGDSGGPLMMNHNANYYIVGITSFKATKYCGTLGLPSIFTKVHSFVDWILDNMEP